MKVLPRVDAWQQADAKQRQLFLLPLKTAYVEPKSVTLGIPNVGLGATGNTTFCFPLGVCPLDMSPFLHCLQMWASARHPSEANAFHG